MLSLSSSTIRRGLVSFGRRLGRSTPVMEVTSTFAIGESRRSLTKDYDKVIRLEPTDVEYKYDDSRFLRGPTYYDEPYIKPTDEEMIELTRIKLEREVERDTITKVDPNAAPFNQVLEGVEDEGRFTQVERIPDLEARWPWVERLLEKKFLTEPIRPGSELIPQMPVTPPDLPYFIQRTRSRLYPLYRSYEVVGRDHKRYWRNRWDGLYNKYHTDILDNLDAIKWQNNEQTITVTMVGKVTGDIWALEEDARTYLEQNSDLPEGHRIMTAVNEVRGTIRFKGDYVALLYKFLREKGF